MKKTLIVIDDHSIVRNGIKMWIESNSEWKVIAMTSDEDDTKSFFENCPNDKLPEVAILDIQLKDKMSFELMNFLHTNYPSVKIVVYSMFDTSGYILMAKDNGATAYISKAESENELLDCLEKVHENTESIKIESLPKIERIDQAMGLLTKQEKRVLKLLLIEKSNEEISKELEIKLHSTENYVNRIYEKLAVSNREEIMKKYK